MINPKALTTAELQDLLADCLRGFPPNKPAVSEALFREGLTASLADDSPSIEIVRQVHAAGLLTFGDLSMVNIILDNMPPDVMPRRATGYCIAAASTVLSALLPLPDTLMTFGRTVVDKVAVREWFRLHGDRLYFDATDGRFRLRTEG